MNKPDAERLARKIETYWRRQGFLHVRADAVLETEAVPSGSSVEWTVRITPPLRNGLPQGATTRNIGPILRSFDTMHSDWRKFDDDPTDQDDNLKEFLAGPAA